MRPPPRKVQVSGASQALTGAELDPVTAMPLGSTTFLLTDASGVLLPLAGGAPNCRI